MTSNPRLRIGLACVAALVCALLAGPTVAAAATSPTLAGSVANSTTLSGATQVTTEGPFSYVAAYSAGRLVAIDTSDPTTPLISGQTISQSSLMNSTNVAIANGYAYVVSKNRNGASGSNINDDGTGNSLTVVDISTLPGFPSIVGSVRDGIKLFGSYGVAVSGHYAFVAAQGCLNGQPCPNTQVGDAFTVVDVANPMAPTVVASIRNSALPAPWTGSGALKHVTSVAISGNFAYLTAAYTNRLTVVDISNPLNPTIVASLLDSTRLNFPVDVVTSGHYAYVVDQITQGRLTVVDISNPSSPTIVGSLVNSTWLNQAYRVRIRNNFAIVSASISNDVAAVDVSDPANPRFAGGLQSTPTMNRTVGLDFDSTGRYAVAVSPYLSTQSNSNFPPFPTQTGTVSVTDLEPTPLSVTITPSSKPADPTGVTSGTFTFAASNAVAAMRCKLDGGTYDLCTTPTSFTYTGISLGTHTFSVQASDPGGNTTTDDYTWTVIASNPPTTPVLDDFNRANGAIGANWSLIKPSGFSAMKVLSNAAADNSSGQFAWEYWNPATFGPDAETYVTIKTYGASDTIRLGARVINAGTNNYSGYFLHIASNGAWSILRVDNGGNAGTLASGPIEPLASGDKIAIRIVGSLITALHFTPSAGWIEIMSYDTASDSIRYTASGSLAVEFKTSTLDDFGGGSLSVNTPPSNVALPSISGSAVVGQQLTASPGTWNGNPAPTFTYAWQLCDASGNNCNPNGAVGSTYTPVAGDAGSTLRVTVTASNSQGNANATSAATAVVQAAPSPPVNTVAPTISGTTTVGQQLTGTTGTWTGNPTPTFTYQWNRCDTQGQNCTPIGGATTSTYTLVQADAGSTIVLAVTGTNTAGNSTANSTATAVVQSSLAPTTPILDNFNRANGGAGANWAVIKANAGFFTMNVLGNVAADSTTSGYAWNYWNAATLGPDCEAYMTINSYSANDTVRIGARVTPGATYSGYFVSITSAGAWSIIRIVNGGGPVTLASGITQTLAAGDKVAIRTVGSVVTALHFTTAAGWTQALRYDTIGDATRYTAAGRLAVEFKTTTIDDFGGGTL